MVVIGLKFFMLIRLFVIIGSYYDPNKLYKTIDNKLKNQTEILRHELCGLLVREDKIRRILRASLFSEYWISDYEKESWRKKIQKCQESRRIILE